MNNFRKFYLFSAAGVFLASFYPLLMGVRVVRDVIRDGMVMQENYPKYIIPYTPISLAVIIAVLLMPVLMKYTGKYALAAASSISFASFFTLELLLEKVVIASTMTIQFADTTVPSTIKLENWQMFMCYVPPQSVLTRSWTPVNVLIGEYSPAFKLHFYIISLVLIIALLNSFLWLCKNDPHAKQAEVESAGDPVGMCRPVSRFMHFCLFYRIFPGRRNYSIPSFSGVDERVFYRVWHNSRCFYRITYDSKAENTIGIHAVHRSFCGYIDHVYW